MHFTSVIGSDGYMSLLGVAASKDIVDISLKAETIFHVGPFAVTNSMIYGLIVACLIFFVLSRAAKSIKVRPGRGITAVIDMLVDKIINILETPLGSRESALRYAPYFAMYFLFIITTNLLGLLPIVGHTITSGGSPLFRPFTADLNGTIAMSLIALVIVQAQSIKETGIKRHALHYFNDKPLNPIFFFIGILEIFSEFTRLLSLSLRLFLNTTVGEILIAVFSSLILSHGRTPLLAIPIILFEILIAGIQAYVFMLITASYLGLNINHHQTSQEAT